MNEKQEAIVVKKYANRRLYHTGTSSYVTLDDLAVMVRDGEEFVVKDAKSGEDLTRSVLTQIIFEQESKGQNLLPISFLRDIIGFYGDSMQSLVPSYLEKSFSSFVEQTGHWRNTMADPFTKSSAVPFEDQVQRNVDAFQKAMSFFNPFIAEDEIKTEETAAKDTKTSPKKGGKPATKEDDLKRLQEEMALMQKRLEQLAGDQ